MGASVYLLCYFFHLYKLFYGTKNVRIASLSCTPSHQLTEEHIMITKRLLPLTLLFALVLAACAPAATVTPEDFLYSGTREEVFAGVVNAVNTQPFPGDTSGWIIQQSDQEGGFVRAILTRTAGNFLTGTRSVTEQISVTVTRVSEDVTEVSIARSNADLAKQLADSIRARLESQFGRVSG